MWHFSDLEPQRSSEDMNHFKRHAFYWLYDLVIFLPVFQIISFKNKLLRHPWVPLSTNTCSPNCSFNSRPLCLAQWSQEGVYNEKLTVWIWCRFFLKRLPLRLWSRFVNLFKISWFSSINSVLSQWFFSKLTLIKWIKERTLFLSLASVNCLPNNSLKLRISVYMWNDFFFSSTSQPCWTCCLNIRAMQGWKT